MVLKKPHDCPTTRHIVFLQTYSNARQSLFWKGMNVDIKKYVVKCDILQRKKK